MPERRAEPGARRMSRARQTSRRRLATTRSATCTDTPEVTFLGRDSSRPAPAGSTIGESHRQEKGTTEESSTGSRGSPDERQRGHDLPTDIDFSQTPPAAKTAWMLAKQGNVAKPCRTLERTLKRTLGWTLKRTLRRTLPLMTAAQASEPHKKPLGLEDDAREARPTSAGGPPCWWMTGCFCSA